MTTTPNPTPPDADPGWHWPQTVPTPPDAGSPLPPSRPSPAPPGRASSRPRLARAIALALVIGVAAGYVAGRTSASTSTSGAGPATPTASVTLPSPAVPTAAPLGSALRTADGATYTVIAYRPVTLAGNARQTPQPGTTFQGIDAQICAGDSTDEIVSAFDFRLQLANGATLLPLVLTSTTGPMLDTNIVAPGQCATGWVYFDPPEPPIVVTLAHTTLRWRLG